MANRPRIVFLPGLLGSTLRDTAIKRHMARIICARNVHGHDAAVSALLAAGVRLCVNDADLLWGRPGFLHWLFAADDWADRLTRGNCYTEAAKITPTGFVEAEFSFLGSSRGKWVFKPYSSIVSELKAIGDVLEFPYDWRLSMKRNADLLRLAIAQKPGWSIGDGREEIPIERQIILIGHSMGGLIARVLVESPSINGHLFVRKVITIGTPHEGAPESFAHFKGLSQPIPENPLVAWIQSLSRLAAVSPIAKDLDAEIVEPATQLRLTQSFASVAELMPVYDFVTLDRSGKKRQRYGDSYKGLQLRKTKMPLMYVLESVRKHLQPAGQLDAWAFRHGVEYAMFALDKKKTVSHIYKRGRRLKVERTKAGDGTVPRISAVPESIRNQRRRVRVSFEITKGGKLEHARLCERRDVRRWVKKEVLEKPQAKYVVNNSAPTTDQFLQMANEIFAAAPDWAKVVISVVRIETRPDDREPSLIDTTTETRREGKSERRYLTNPPPHTDKLVGTVEAGPFGDMDYVWIQSNANGARSGGVLFLPAADERHLYLVTYLPGRINKDWKTKCGNEHHAEMQFVRWFREQKWRDRIARIWMWNRTLSKRAKNRQGQKVKGYSPCTPCCDGLAHLVKSENDSRGRKGISRIDGLINWEMVYDGRTCDHHPTTKKSIALMTEDKKWELMGNPPEPDA